MRFISSSRNRRSLRITLLLGAALVVIPLEALLLPEILDSRPACVKADEWVQAHSGDLPTLYDQFASYPMSHRRAIFGSLAPEARAALWHEQLSRFQAERDLTLEQREFVERCKREILTVENYARGGPGHEVIKGVLEEIETLFSDDGDRRIFLQLGPTTLRLTSLEGARLRLAARLQRMFAGDSGRVLEFPQRTGLLSGEVHAQSPGTCNCNVENAGYFWWECGTGLLFCFANGCAQWTACGPFGFYSCDGCCCWWHHPENCYCS